jgi:hypothetical protein
VFHQRLAQALAVEGDFFAMQAENGARALKAIEQLRQ